MCPWSLLAGCIRQLAKKEEEKKKEKNTTPVA